MLSLFLGLTSSFTVLYLSRSLYGKSNAICADGRNFHRQESQVHSAPICWKPRIAFSQLRQGLEHIAKQVGNV